MSCNKADIAEVVGALLETADKKADELFAGIKENPAIVGACKLIEQGNAEDFSFLVDYRINEVLSALVRSVLNRPSANNEDDEDAALLVYAEFIFLHYSEIERHYERLIRQFEGFACCADKSRTIMRRLLRFFTHGEEIEFDLSDEKAYWLPKRLFTTHEEILEFFHGIHEFYYGDPSRYIKAFADILKKEKQQ